MNTGALLEAVEQVVRVTGDIAMRSFGRGLTVERKADGSDVTDADRAAERAAREWIGARFPGDAIIGEEFGETNSGATRRWYLDPIDGTTSFVSRVPLWGTLVGVAEGDVVLAGAIHCPAVSEIVCAAVGEGCWWNGARARVSRVDSLSEATVLTTSGRFPEGLQERQAGWERLESAARTSRGWGDCYGYLLVATGRAEVMADPVLAAWDAAALAPVVQEAGGVFSDWSGRPTAFGGSAVATNAALSQAARSLLGVRP